MLKTLPIEELVSIDRHFAILNSKLVLANGSTLWNRVVKSVMTEGLADCSGEATSKYFAL